MKKKIIAITLISAMLLSACSTGANEPADTADTEQSEVSSVSVSETEEETSADEEESETSASAETETSESETEAAAENISGRYYELKISSENTAFSIDDFADKAAVEKAAELVKQSDTYKDNLAEAEEIKDVVIEDGYDFSFEPVFLEGITDDFDGDGREESFFMLMPDLEMFEVLVWVKSYLFYADADGDVTMMPGVFYANTAILRPQQPDSENIIFQEIMYNGFSHVLVTTGFNNNTASAYIYSAYDNVPKLETYQRQINGTLDDIALLCSANQVGYNWLAVWDNEEKCYVAPECRALSDDEKAEVTSDPAVSDVLDELFSSDPYTSAVLIGGKYYSFANDYSARTFVRNGDSFELCDTRISDCPESCAPDKEIYPDVPSVKLPYAEGFDFSVAVSGMVPLA